MKMLTKAIERKLPKIYETQETPLDEKVAVVKFFSSWSNWTLYGIEYDPEEKEFFGLVIGHEKEFGYFTLDDLQSVNGPHGLKIERDRYWSPTKIKDIKY